MVNLQTRAAGLQRTTNEANAADVDAVDDYVHVPQMWSTNYNRKVLPTPRSTLEELEIWEIWT